MKLDGILTFTTARGQYNSPRNDAGRITRVRHGVTTEELNSRSSIYVTVRAACGVRVRYNLNEAFDTSDPRACPKCNRELKPRRAR
jgi:hypothetical protein